MCVLVYFSRSTFFCSFFYFFFISSFNSLRFCSVVFISAHIYHRSILHTRAVHDILMFALNSTCAAKRWRRKKKRRTKWNANDVEKDTQVRLVDRLIVRFGKNSHFSIHYPTHFFSNFSRLFRHTWRRTSNRCELQRNWMKNIRRRKR